MAHRRTPDEFFANLASLIKARGISALSVGEIARRLNCSRRRLYAVAQTKEGLLISVARTEFDLTRAAGDAAAARETTIAARISAYLSVGVQMASELSQAFLNDLEATEVGRATFDEYQMLRSEGLLAIILTGVETGEIVTPHPRLATEIFLGTALRIRRPEFLMASGLTLAEAFEESAKMILNGMASPLSDSENAARLARSDRGRSDARRPRRLSVI